MKDFNYIVYSKIGVMEFDAGSEFKLYHILEHFRSIGFITYYLNGKWIITAEEIKKIQGRD